MYQANQGQAAGGGPSAAGGGPSAEAGGSDHKVVDVDFEEVKDDDSKKSA
jgi:molecular chaperone DnaK